MTHLNLIPPIAPITLADLPDDWIEERREIIAREGNAVRACASSLNIEVKSLRENRWLRLPLPCKAPSFSAAADRDFVLDEIIRPEPRAKKEGAK